MHIGPTSAVIFRATMRTGTPAVMSGIEFVGINHTNITSTTVPASEADDIAFLGAGRISDSTTPTVPTTSPTWDAPTDDAERDISISSATGAAFVRYKYPTVSAETTGTCTNAQSVLCAVYRGVDLTTPIIAMKFASGNGTSINFPALTYTSSTAWVALGWRNGGTNPATPSGALTGLRVTGNTRGWHDSDGQMSSFAGTTYTIPVVQNWVCWALAFESA